MGWGKNMNDKTDNETKKEAVELLDKVAGKTGVPSIPYNIVKEHLDSVGQAYENAATTNGSRIIPRISPRPTSKSTPRVWIIVTITPRSDPINK